MSQTSYSHDMTAAVEGMVADGAGAPNSIVSRSNPDDEILFGVAVAVDTAGDGYIKLPDGGSVIIDGIAIRDITVPNGSASADNTFPVDSSVPIMKKGRIWVMTEETVDPSDNVFARYTASGGNTVLGRFRTDGDTSKAIQITQARFLTSTTGAGLALLEINLP